MESICFTDGKVHFSRNCRGSDELHGSLTVVTSIPTQSRRTRPRIWDIEEATMDSSSHRPFRDGASSSGSSCCKGRELQLLLTLSTHRIRTPSLSMSSVLSSVLPCLHPTSHGSLHLVQFSTLHVPGHPVSFLLLSLLGLLLPVWTRPKHLSLFASV